MALLAGCMCSRDDTPPVDTCTPYTSLCIAGDMYLCQPTGQVDLVEHCAGECVDGECTDGGEDPDATSDVGDDAHVESDAGVEDTGIPNVGPTEEDTVDVATPPDTKDPAPDVPEPDVPDPDDPAWTGSGACKADFAKFKSPDLFAQVDECNGNCAGEAHGDDPSAKEPKIECMTECLTGTLLASCAGCTATLFVCFGTDCHESCDVFGTPECDQCIADVCYPPFATCSGIDMLKL